MRARPFVLFNPMGGWQRGKGAVSVVFGVSYPPKINTIHYPILWFNKIEYEWVWFTKEPDLFLMNSLLSVP